MSNQHRQQIRLHERHRQWELRLQGNCGAHGDFYLERGFQAASRLVFSAFSLAMQTACEQLESYAQAHDAGPSPDVWRTLGARDRMLTPRPYGLHLVQRVEAAMSAGDDMFVNNALTIKGLANVGPNSSLIFVFVPMTSLFTQPDIAYTMTDLTSRVFVPADLERYALKGISEIEATQKESLQEEQEVEEERKDEDEEQITEEELEEPEEEPEEEEQEEEEEPKEEEPEEEPENEEPKEEPKEKEPKEEPEEEPEEEPKEEEPEEEEPEKEPEGKEDDEEEQRRLREEEEKRLKEEEERRRREAEEAEMRLREEERRLQEEAERRRREAEEAEMRLREEERRLQEEAERRRREAEEAEMRLREEERRLQEEAERRRREAEEAEMRLREEERRLQEEAERRRREEEEQRKLREEEERKRKEAEEEEQRRLREEEERRRKEAEEEKQRRLREEEERRRKEAEEEEQRRLREEEERLRREAEEEELRRLQEEARRLSEVSDEEIEFMRVKRDSQTQTDRRSYTERLSLIYAKGSRSLSIERSKSVSPKALQSSGATSPDRRATSSRVQSPRGMSGEKRAPSSAGSYPKKSDWQPAVGAGPVPPASSQVQSPRRKSSDRSAPSSAGKKKSAVRARSVSPTTATDLSSRQHSPERPPLSGKPILSAFVSSKQTTTVTAVSSKQPSIEPSSSPRKPTQNVVCSVSPSRPTSAVPGSSRQITIDTFVSPRQPTTGVSVSPRQTTLVPSVASRLSTTAPPASLRQPTPEVSVASRQPTPKELPRRQTMEAIELSMHSTSEESVSPILVTPDRASGFSPSLLSSGMASCVGSPSSKIREDQIFMTSVTTKEKSTIFEKFDIKYVREEVISDRKTTTASAEPQPSISLSAGRSSRSHSAGHHHSGGHRRSRMANGTRSASIGRKYHSTSRSVIPSLSPSSNRTSPSFRASQTSNKSHSRSPSICSQGERNVTPEIFFSKESQLSTSQVTEESETDRSNSRSQSPLSLLCGEGKPLFSFSAASQVKNWTLDGGLCTGILSKSPSPVISPSRKTVRQNGIIAGLSGKSESASLSVSPLLVSPFRKKTSVGQSRAGSLEGDSVDPEIGSSVDGPSPKLKTQRSLADLVEKMDKDFSELPCLSKAEQQEECSEVSENTDDDVTLETVSSACSEDDDWKDVDDLFKEDTEEATPTTQRHSSPTISQRSRSAVKCELEESRTVMGGVKEVVEVQPALITAGTTLSFRQLTAEKGAMDALGSFAAPPSGDGHEVVSRKEGKILTAVSPTQHCVEGTPSVTPFETALTLSPIEMKTETKYFEIKIPVEEERTSPLVFNAKTAMKWTGKTKTVPIPFRTTSQKVEASVFPTEEIISLHFIQDAEYAQTLDQIKMKRAISPTQFTTETSSVPCQPFEKVKVQHRHTPQEPTASSNIRWSKKSVSSRNHSTKRTVVLRQNSPESTFLTRTHSLEPTVLSRKHSPETSVISMKHSPERDIFSRKYSSEPDVFFREHSSEPAVVSRKHSPETGVLSRKHLPKACVISKKYSPNQGVLSMNISPDLCASSKKNLQEAVALSRKHSPEQIVFSRNNSPELSISSRKHSPKAPVSPRNYSPESVVLSLTHSPESAVLSQKYSTESDVSPKKHSHKPGVLTRTQGVSSQKYLQEAAALSRIHSPESGVLSRNNSPKSSISPIKYSPESFISLRTHSPESAVLSCKSSTESAVSSRKRSPESRFLPRKHSPKPGVLLRKHSPEPNVSSKQHLQEAVALSRKYSPESYVLSRNNSPESFISLMKHSPKASISPRIYSPESFISSRTHSPESDVLSCKYSTESAISSRRHSPESIASSRKHSPESAVLSCKNLEGLSSRKPTPETTISPKRITPTSAFLKQSTPELTLSSKKSSPERTTSRDSIPEIPLLNRKSTPEPSFSSKKSSPERTVLSRRSTPVHFASSERSLGSKSNSPRQLTPERIVSSRKSTPELVVLSRRTTPESAISPRKHSSESPIPSMKLTPKTDVSPKRTKLTARHPSPQQTGLSMQPTPEKEVKLSPKLLKVDKEIAHEMVQDNLTDPTISPSSSVQNAFGGLSSQILEYFQNEYFKRNEPEVLKPLSSPRCSEVSTEIEPYLDAEELVDDTWKQINMTQIEERSAESKSDVQGQEVEYLHKTAFRRKEAFSVSPKAHSLSPPSPPFGAFEPRLTINSFQLPFENVNVTPPDAAPKGEGSPMSSPSSPKSASSKEIQERFPGRSSPLSFQGHAPRTSAGSPRRYQKSSTPQLSRTRQAGPFTSDDVFSRYSSRKSTSGQTKEAHQTSSPTSAILIKKASPLSSITSPPSNDTSFTTLITSPLLSPSKEGQIPLHPSRSYIQRLQKALATAGSESQEHRAAKPASPIPRLATKAETYDSTSSVKRAGSSKVSPRQPLPAYLHVERTQKVTPSKNRMALAKLLAAQRKNANAMTSFKEPVEDGGGHVQMPGNTPGEMTGTKSLIRNTRTKRSVSEGLKTLLAAQRKSVHKKRQGGSVERTRETKVPKDGFQHRANQFLPHKQAMTSVKEELVKHKLPPTSTVTITRRTVTYTAEPLLPTSAYASPPRILSWPVAMPTSLPQPIPIPSRESVTTEPEQTFFKASSVPTAPLRSRLFLEPSSKTSPTSVEQKQTIQDSHRTSTIPSAFSSFRTYTTGSTPTGDPLHPVQDSRAVTKTRNKSAFSRRLSPSAELETIGTHLENQLDQISQMNTTSDSTLRRSGVQRSLEHNKGAEELKDLIPMEGREPGHSFISRNKNEDVSNVFSVFTNESQERPISPKTSSRLRTSPKSPLRRRMVNIVERQRLLEERRKRNKSLGCSFDSPEMTTPSANRSPIERSPADHPGDIVGIPNIQISRKHPSRRSPSNSPGRNVDYPNSAADRGFSKKSLSGDYPGNILTYPEFQVTPLPLNQQMQSYRHAQGLVGDSPENIFFSKLRVSSFQPFMKYIPDLGQQKQMKHVTCNEDNSELRDMFRYRSKYPNDDASIFENYKEVQNMNINRTSTVNFQHDNWNADTNSSCADSTSKHNLRREWHRVNAACELKTQECPRSAYEKTTSGGTFKRGNERPKETVTNMHEKDKRTAEASHCQNGAQEASKTDQITRRFVRESRQRRESTETSRDKIAVTVEERQQLEEMVARETYDGTRYKKLQKQSRQLTIKNKEKCISMKKEKSHSEEYIIRNNEQATLQRRRGSHLPKASPLRTTEETERPEVCTAQTELAVSLATRHCQDAEEYRATASRSRGGIEFDHQSKKVKRKDDEPLSLSEELRNAGWSPEPHLDLLRNTLRGVPTLNGNGAGDDLLQSARLKEETFKGHYDRYTGEEFQNVNTSANPSSVVDLCEHELPAGFFCKNIHVAKTVDFFEQRSSRDFCKDELIMQGSYFSFNEGKDEAEGSLNDPAGEWNIRSESNNETNFVTGVESACDFNRTCTDKHFLQFSKSEKSEAPESESLLLHPPTQWDVHNINNSGNDESQSSYSPTARGKRNTHRNSRQNKIDKLGWTRGEHVGVAGNQNLKEETRLLETKALLKSFPRIRSTVLRKRRSFGRSYLSRLLARHIGERASDCDCIQNPSSQTHSENYTGNCDHRASKRDAVLCGAEGGGDREEAASNCRTSEFSESKLQRTNRLRAKCVVYHKDQSRGECTCTVDVPDALLPQSQRRFSNLQECLENTAAVSPSCDLSSFPHDESQSNDSADSTYEPGEILNCSTGSCDCLAPSKHNAEIPVGPFLREHNTQDAEISLLCEECEKWNLDQVADGHEDGEENTHSFHTIEDEATDEGAQAENEVEVTSHFYSGQDVATNIPASSYFMSPADSGHFHHTNSASPPGTTATSSSQETALSSSHSIAVEPTDNNNGAVAISDSMMQAYGYNPMTESPFTARGYPELQQNVMSLDHINVPFVKRKALAFLRDEKEEFVEVGRGTYGCVYLAQAATRRGTTKVVVKDFFTDSTSWDLIVHEARMLCYLQDTGVIPHFYGLLKRRSSADDFSLIQQYFGHGKTLHTVIVNKEPLQPLVWQDIAWQLARGLLLIHDRHVLLNDLKGDNVLIDLRRERKVIKYIDVGMATFRKGLNFHLPKDQMSKFNFLAPEVRAGAFTSPMSDVFSLGYLLDQINRLARLELLRYLSMGCMESVPAERFHLPDVVDALELHSKALTGACYAASAGGEPSFKAASASQMDKKLKSLLV